MQRPLNKEMLETKANESALALVLQAEQAANAAIESDLADARDCIDRARAMARAIAARAAQRTTRVHELTDAALARQLAQIEEEQTKIQADAAQEINTRDELHLRAVVARVADRLAQGLP